MDVPIRRGTARRLGLALLESEASDLGLFQVMPAGDTYLPSLLGDAAAAALRFQGPV